MSSYISNAILCNLLMTITPLYLWNSSLKKECWNWASHSIILLLEFHSNKQLQQRYNEDSMIRFQLHHKYLGSPFSFVVINMYCLAIKYIVISICLRVQFCWPNRRFRLWQKTLSMSWHLSLKTCHIKTDFVIKSMFYKWYHVFISFVCIHWICSY